MLIQGIPADVWHMNMRASSYRMARWHMRHARKWLVTLDAFLNSRAGKRQIAFALDTVFWHLNGARRARETAREYLDYARLYRDGEGRCRCSSCSYESRKPR